MKRIYILILLTGVAFPVAAYQTGPSQSNFSAGPSAAKASTFTAQTRAFTNYASRHPGWSRGVNTQTVQTQAAYNPQAAQQAPAQTPVAPGIDAAAAMAALTKGAPAAKAAVAPAAAPAAAKAAGNEQPQQAAAAATKEGAAVDPAAMMQQMGMGDMMKNLGALGGLMQGGAASGSGAAQGGQTPAMPAGMPDMSKLLQGMGVGNKPK